MTGIGTNRAKKSAAALGRPTSADLQFGSVTTKTEHVDVLIVGAGLSGIGAAHHLQAAFPRRSYAILEARDALGGTWDLFRYPGVRSDSDMHTLGYRFRPWTKDKAITDGPSILDYVRDTATEAGIDQHIRYGHRVERAAWSTAAATTTTTSATPPALTASTGSAAPSSTPSSGRMTSTTRARRSS
jgi:cation diffusion facilitator CzcD-associated flavoprotein CzcO